MNNILTRKRHLLAVSALCLVGACEATTDVYLFRNNGSVSQTDTDYFECEVAAARGVPQETRIGTTPSYTTPTQTSCYNTGYSVQCQTTGGQTYGGQTYTYDANSELRATYFARCLASRGYSVVELPKCDRAKVPAEVLQKLAGKQRPPREDACYVAITERAGNVVYASELTP
ncbi:hypothetical protein SAMN05421763_1145 [[Luteovulum] sphaeroides subsp. megalophilum]|uniref:hypothetical protein n=1 Tax=Cereibacter sphaeroides TaxID=1063 RepID=UPI000B6444EC|nr:hypothetical protein [Cereibacter sphaeroides]SNT39258.1 hypothetical protein SAMN05421763_1145 [[Luteovulum] sphaeroides subsp. megalophilum]